MIVQAFGAVVFVLLVLGLLGMMFMAASGRLREK